LLAKGLLMEGASVNSELNLDLAHVVK